MRDDTSDAAEREMDALLGVRTGGRDESHADQDNNPYEPTPYAVLERLASSGLVGKRDVLVDYGCGKGRVGFYLSYQLRCRTVGVERDEVLLAAAERNRRATTAPRAKVSFVQADAATFEPPAEANRFYFFNPFSATVFERVLARVRASLDSAPRDARLVLYYPDDAYRELLERTPWLACETELDCRRLFAGEDGPADPREVVLAYRAR